MIPNPVLLTVHLKLATVEGSGCALGHLDLVGFPPGGVYNGAMEILSKGFTKTTVTRLAGS